MRIILLLSLILNSAFTGAQTASWSWAKGASNSSWVVAFDGCINPVTNEAIVMGYFFGPTALFGANGVVNSDSTTREVFIVKYSSTGGVVFAKRLSTPSDEIPSKVCTDASGNIYIVGRTSDADFTINGDVHVNNGGWDWFLVKLNSAGVYQWARTGGGSYDENAYDVAVDNSGNVYVTGDFGSSSFTFGSYILNNAPFGKNAFLLKFNSSGTPGWGVSIGANSNEAGYGVCVDANGDVTLIGEFASASIALQGASVLNNTFPGTLDVMVVKYSSLGSQLWAKSFGGQDNDRGLTVMDDGAGNVVIGVKTSSSSITMGSYTITNSGGYDIVLSKLNSTGNVVWANAYGGNGDETAARTTITNQGRIAMNVYYESAFTMGSISLPASPTLNKTFAVIILDAVGYPLVANWPSCQGDVYGNGIAADASGNIYVCGSYTNQPVTFGATTLNSGSGIGNTFLAKCDVSIGIDDYESVPADIQIFPNPSIGVFNISSSSSVINKIHITDVAGHLIYEGSSDEKSIRINIKEAGIYFCKITTDKGTTVRKIINN